jgi:hypothetical protein
MPISCTPQDLQTAAQCFECIPNREAVITMLLAQIAGGSMDPQTLSNQARCFECLDGQHAQVQTMLLCQIANL